MKKIESLNLFRGICGYGVAVCHFFSYLYDSRIYEYISFLFVDMFFVLSGFVLYPQLRKVYKSRKNIKIFYYRRWMRTIPLFLIALISFSLVFSNFNYDTLKYFLFIQKFYPDFMQTDYMVVAWSLSVEEWFYLVFPLILFIYYKNNIIKIFIYSLILIYALKLLYIFNYDDSNFYRTGTLLRLDAILFGSIIAHYFDYIKKFKYNFLLLCIFIFFYFYFENSFLSNNNLNFLYVLLIQAISMSGIIFFINNNTIVEKKELNKIYDLFANQTYSVYLFHFIFIYFIKIYDLIDIKFIFFYYLLSLFVFSTLIFSFIEKPILKLRPKYNEDFN